MNILSAESPSLQQSLRKSHMYPLCCSVTESCSALCNPMDRSTPGFPVLYLPEFAQTHVYWVSDAIQPSHPLSPPFPPVLSLSQRQGLFQKINCSYQVAKVLELQLSISPPMNIQGWFPLGLTDLISFLSKGLSRVFSSTTIQKNQFSSTQLSLWSNFHIYMWLLKKQQQQQQKILFTHMDLCWQRDISAF